MNIIIATSNVAKTTTTTKQPLTTVGIIPKPIMMPGVAAPEVMLNEAPMMMEKAVDAPALALAPALGKSSLFKMFLSTITTFTFNKKNRSSTTTSSFTSSSKAAHSFR